MTMNNSIIRVEQVVKSYPGRREGVQALDRIQVEIEEREFVVVRGPSGSGKTTLLLTLGGMMHPTSGNVWVEDRDIYALTGKERSRFRAEKIGFVFQMFHLIPYLSVLDNVAVAARRGMNTTLRREVISLLESLGLSHRLQHKPSELSAGEKQRTAIARALLNRPKIILADEPTGNLDPDNARDVLHHLSTFHLQGGTVLLVTHGEEADRFASRMLYLRDGRLEEASVK